MGMAMLFLMAVATAAVPLVEAPEFEPLTSSATGSLCTDDTLWCISMAKEDGSPLIVTKAGKQVASWTPDSDGRTLSPVPILLRLKDGGALLGVAARESVMFSGGGGEIVEQRVLWVQPDKEVREVLSIPLHTDLMIRACFSEKDAAKRARACHDEYALHGKLGVTGETADGLPMLSYAVEASSYPRGVSRNGDSLAGPSLRKADLVWKVDAGCTYRRTFRFDAASGGYKPDLPLPDCSQYTEQ
jgi:hypothetical protein